MKVFASVILLAVAVAAEPPVFRQQRQYYLARQQQENPVASAPYAARGWRPAGPSFELPQRQQNIPQQQYGAPEVIDRQTAAPQQQYGTPAAPQQKYGAPAAPQQQYGAPAAPQQQYGAPAAPQQQYGAPAAPQQQYGTPAAPQQQYGTPAAPQQQYGAPEQQYGAPQTYNAPVESATTEVPNSTEFDETTTISTVTESESEPVNSVNELDDEETDDQGKNQQQQKGEYYVALPDGRLQRVTYVSRQDVEAMKYFAKVQAENVEPIRGPIYAYSPLQDLQVVPAGLRLSVAPAQVAAPLAPVAPISVSSVPAVPVAPETQQRPERLEKKPAKLEIEPVPQVQYQYDNPAPVVPLATPVSSSYTTYTANYQVPAQTEARYLLTFQ